MTAAPHGNSTTDGTPGTPRALARPLARARALRPGDRVAVVAASGRPDAARLASGVAALRGLGLEVDVLPSASAAHPRFGYLAGEDALRADDLTTALTSPQYAAVFLARGGYGMQRALELTDWQTIVGTAPAPRAVVGFSDVTALSEALAVHLGWASVYGPMPASLGFEPGDGGFERLVRLLFRPETVAGLSFPQARTLVPGAGEGVSLGGTVTLLACGVGTPTSRPARGGVLLLEDVGEEPYRLDRFLTQLRRSGYLDGVAGIVCGTFTDCGPQETVDALLLDRLGDLGAPVLAGADIGHGVPMQPYPLGLPVRLDTAAAQQLTFLRPALLPTP